MISVESKGSFSKTEHFLASLSGGRLFSNLERYGREGTRALQNATPVESGETAAQWYHEVIRKNGTYSIVWRNGNVVDGVPIAIILQYGHGTGTGGYVQGRDYINPIIKPLFDKIDRDVWKAVKTA